jgi:hypothetical protein
MPSGDTDPYKAVPLIEFSNNKLDPKTINIFSKMWDREKKYTGKPYDLLDDKLKILSSVKVGENHVVLGYGRERPMY